MPYSKDMQIKLKFGELLRQRGITPNKLAASGHGLSRNTIYGLANPPKNRVRLDLDVLANAMSALEKETGQPVSLNDVLEVIEKPKSFEEMDLETRAWHDADLAPPLEPYDWGDLDPNTLGRAVINGIVQ